MYDLDLIGSWTPHELNLFIKARKKADVDQMEQWRKKAILEREYMNSKHIKAHRPFNPEDELQRIEEQHNPEEAARKQDEKHQEVKRKHDRIRQLRGEIPSS